MSETPVVPALDGGAEPRVWPPEQRLLVALAAWSTWSIGVGGGLWRLGRRGGSPTLRGAGRVSLAWGAVDVAVVGWGAWRGRRAHTADPAARARRMALLTGANALLDVTYVAGGVRWSRLPGRRGEGLATALHGVALLYLDTRYCLEFAALARSEGRPGPLGPLHSWRARERRRPASGGPAGPQPNDTRVIRPVS